MILCTQITLYLIVRAKQSKYSQIVIGPGVISPVDPEIIDTVQDIRGVFFLTQH